MTQEFINRHSYILFMLTFVFGILLYNILRFKSSDELCALILMIFYIAHVVKTKSWEVNKFFLITLVVFLFYTFYSIKIHSNSTKAIFFDLIIQLKPYVAFFAIYQLAPIFTKTQELILKQSALLAWCLFFPIAIGAVLVDPKILSVVFEHPTNYATCVASIALIYLFCGNYTLKERLTFILLLSAGLASGRAKYAGFFVLASFFVLYFNSMKRFKLDLKTVLLLLVMLAGIIIVAKDKIDLYFVQAISGDEKDMLARGALYLTSFEIIKDYMPFGCGLASFGTHASGVFYSEIYQQYGIDTIWGLTKQYPSFIADTYYPSLAQFGLVGVCLYFLFWLFILLRFVRLSKQSGQVKFFVLFLLIAGYLFIENIAEAAFTSNKGFFMMMLLGFILSSYKNELKTGNSNNI